MEEDDYIEQIEDQIEQTESQLEYNHRKTPLKNFQNLIESLKIINDDRDAGKKIIKKLEKIINGDNTKKNIYKFNKSYPKNKVSNVKSLPSFNKTRSKTRSKTTSKTNIKNLKQPILFTQSASTAAAIKKYQNQLTKNK
jgi:hypothetical protein